MDEIKLSNLDFDRRETRETLTGPALRTFFRIADAWHLSVEEQARLLGLQSTSTVRRWRRGQLAALSRDKLERISYVFGIYAALGVLLPSAEQADAWLHKANAAPVFNGSSALDRMLAGNVSDLYAVRQYLDAQVNA